MAELLSEGETDSRQNTLFTSAFGLHPIQFSQQSLKSLAPGVQGAFAATPPFEGLARVVLPVRSGGHRFGSELYEVSLGFP